MRRAGRVEKAASNWSPSLHPNEEERRRRRGGKMKEEKPILELKMHSTRGRCFLKYWERH